MAKFEFKLPEMGESIQEATITSWLKKEGDSVASDEVVVEVATDKVDSEVPSEVEGTLTEILFKKDSVVKVGQVIAIIQTDQIPENKSENKNNSEEIEPIINPIKSNKIIEQQNIEPENKPNNTSEAQFYSPLVKNIAIAEGISKEELSKIKGTGKGGRVTKNDILSHLEKRDDKATTITKTKDESTVASSPTPNPPIANNADEIIEMSRMGKLISKHMTESLKVSAHVQSFIEIDVTNIVKWREQIKNSFFKREGEKLTFTPIFMQAIASTIKKYPLINIRVDGDKVIKKRDINIGMATALQNGNLIVPVIKNADGLNLVGMTKVVNNLAKKAREGKLSPEQTQGGTYTVTNIGSFGSITGTPIINQPQVAILALGAIRKMPAVIETEDGDFIGIRHKMIVSHSYDHRVVNGAMGGMFIKTLKEILESWSPTISID